MNTAFNNKDILLFGEESERLLFRKLEDSDFSIWLRFCEDPESLKYFAFSESISPQEKCQAWFERVNYRYTNHLGGMNALIDKSTQAFIGQCGLLIQTVDDIQELEIGYSLMPEHRGKGYAIEAARKCRDFAFQKQVSDSLISIIHIDNQDSSKVAINNGMKWEKQTVYNGLPVNVYRIKYEEWQPLERKSKS